MSAAEHALTGAAEIPLSLRGPASTRVVAGFGFWLFLLSDILIFAALFAAYSVLSGETAGGPSATDLFDRKHSLEQRSRCSAILLRDLNAHESKFEELA